MAYSEDTRKMVLRYLANGHTYEEARKELGISISTIKEWKKLLNETGGLEKRGKHRSASKFPSDSLERFIESHPDATLKDIAEHFGGSISGAHDALARAGITFKKRAFLH